MAKWLRDYLSFGSRRVPPQPPKPDYTESEILKAYRVQKSLDFEDPYEGVENRGAADPGDAAVLPAFGSPLKSSSLDVKAMSPKHRLIKVDSQELGRTKILLSAVSIEDSPQPVVPSAPIAGETDYSDPFDAHLHPRAQLETAPKENNGYMEPFEAQRVITELQRGPACSRPRGGVQLYDTPYEEQAEEGRESRLPQDDDRPADEYDQPWEWKKDHISKAFAVQFDGTEWDCPSSPIDMLRVTRPSPLTGGASKLRKPVEHHAAFGERVEPSLALEKQVWYHGALSRSEAESLLTLCKECSYLVRNSQTNRSDYSLSLRSCQGFMHMKFTVSKEGKYILGQNSPPFNTIPEVIYYYTTHKLPVRGAEHLSLLYPVVVQTL